MNRQRGFTLIELMVVLAIIAIMSTLIVSVATTPGNPAYASADITSQLTFARQRAIQTRRVHRVQFEQNLVSIWQSVNVGFQDAVTFENIQTTRMPAGVVVWDVNPTIPLVAPGANPPQDVSPILGAIDFRPDGSCNGGVVYVTDQNSVRKFRVLTYPKTGGVYLREDW